MRKESRRWCALAVALPLAGLLGLASPGSAGAAPNNAMKDLMKRMGAAATGGDAKALVPLLAQAKTMKPADPELAGWDAVAEAGRSAAEKGDMAGAKASCKSCHTDYRDKFKTKYGSKAP